jgi:hypothetical protein
MAQESPPSALRARVARFENSAAGRFWNQLSTADFMNSSFAFAALAVLSAFPLLAVSSAAVGLDVITFLVGFGVCLHAGADFGRMWNDWQDERAVDVVSSSSGRR